MAHGFWKVHSQKPSFPYRLFMRKVRTVALTFQNSMFDPNLRTLHPSLMKILTQELHLTVEANTCSVLRSCLFDEWCSSDPNDHAFGSLGSFWETDLSGKNSLLFGTIDNRTIARVHSLLNTQVPTRLVIVTESSPPSDKALLKVASISSHFPLVVPGTPETTMHSNQSFEIILAINRESMLVDPIDWERFSGKIQE